MKFFKVKPELNKYYSVTREDLKQALNDTVNAPNIRLKQNDRYYGVCPACDNPVQLIGIFPKITREPYAKHTGETIPNVATHNQERYEYCPYRTKHKIRKKDQRLKDVTQREIDLYNLMRERFDQFIYLIQRDTGLYFSFKKIKELIQEAYNSIIWMYTYSDFCNLPYTVLYIGPFMDLYGRYVKIGSPLYQLLMEYNILMENGYIQGYKKITRQPNGEFFDWTCSFFDFEHEFIDNRYHDTQIIRVYDRAKDHKGYAKLLKTITINIDREEVYNLLHSDRHRNPEIVKIAKEVMPESDVYFKDWNKRSSRQI